jgi:hypothetical protein
LNLKFQAISGFIPAPGLRTVSTFPFGIAILLLAMASGSRAQGQKQAEQKDMKLVGSSDLQGRSAYQPTIEKQGDRYIAYIGHHAGTVVNPLTGKEEVNGTSILDVTDPGHPRYLAHLPGEPSNPQLRGENGGAQMARVCTGLPHADKNKFFLLRSYGNSAHEIFDVTDPSKPTRVAKIGGNLRDTHKSWWECDTGIAYLVSGVPDWRAVRMMQVYDLSDPAHPVFIRNFGLPGQQPGSTGTAPSDLHGAMSTGPKGNRLYLAYGTTRNGVLQIVDRNKLLNGPKEPTDENLKYPQISRVDLPPDVGAHTAFPILGVTVPEYTNFKMGKVRDFIALTAETTDNECQQPRQMVRFFDITDEAIPVGVATWTVHEGAEDFCEHGGRFGTHSSNENMTPIYYKRVLFIAHFNAGVRAIDVRDPFNPKEIAYFVPPITDKTDKRCVGTGADQHCKVAIQTNNVEVDDRGYIYIVDRANTGMAILELSGEARSIANLP